MDSTQDLSTVALNAMRKRMTEILPNQITKCVEELSDDQLWWRANDESNSAGNLILHLSGSITHYFCRGIGGFDYKRDRPAEFSERGPITREALLSIFNETIKMVSATFDSFDPSRLLDAGEEPSYYPTIFDQIYGVSVHLAVHAGQIVYITKLLKTGSVDELWIKAHNLK
jgi:hypothetical protein